MARASECRLTFNRQDDLVSYLEKMNGFNVSQLSPIHLKDLMSLVADHSKEPGYREMEQKILDGRKFEQLCSQTDGGIELCLVATNTKNQVIGFIVYGIAEDRGGIGGYISSIGVDIHWMAQQKGQQDKPRAVGTSLLMIACHDLLVKQKAMDVSVLLSHRGDSLTTFYKNVGFYCIPYGDGDDYVLNEQNFEAARNRILSSFKTHSTTAQQLITPTYLSSSQPGTAPITVDIKTIREHLDKIHKFGDKFPIQIQTEEYLILALSDVQIICLRPEDLPEARCVEFMYQEGNWQVVKNSLFSVTKKLESPSDEVFEQFKEETIQALCAVGLSKSHEPIQIRDQTFIFTRFIDEGITLAQALNNDHIPAEDIMLCLYNSLQNIVQIRDKGILHLDIKPSHVMFPSGILINFDMFARLSKDTPNVGIYPATRLPIGDMPNPIEMLPELQECLESALGIPKDMIAYDNELKAFTINVDSAAVQVNTMIQEVLKIPHVKKYIQDKDLNFIEEFKVHKNFKVFIEDFQQHLLANSAYSIARPH